MCKSYVASSPASRSEMAGRNLPKGNNDIESDPIIPFQCPTQATLACITNRGTLSEEMLFGAICSTK